MKKEHVVIHHSATKDGTAADDWAAIKRFHTSYRHEGRILTKAEYQHLRSAGVRGLVGPWRDIGYHYGVERVNGEIDLRLGRHSETDGAHCMEGMMNTLGLGFCIVGNFDIAPPDDELLEKSAVFLKRIITQLGIPVHPDRIHMHREFATYKSCPGKLFPFARFLALVDAA